MTVQFINVAQHDTSDDELRMLGSFFGSGESVDAAWWEVAENLAEREGCDPRDFSYDEWVAA